MLFFPHFVFVELLPNTVKGGTDYGEHFTERH